MNTGNITIIESESNFKKIDKSLIENDKIDCLTLGVYTKIVVLGKKWNLNIKGLSYHLNISDSKIRKSISLLEEEGYIKRTAVRNERGQCTGWDYKVYPIPVPLDERTRAGLKSGNSTEYPKNRQHGLPTTRFTDNTENGGDNIYRLKEIIDLDNKETKKEKEDTKVSKKGSGVILKEIVDYWNEHCQSYASVNILTEKRKIAINKLMQNNHANIDDVKKAMDILESADSFWKGDNDKSWKASFDWFIKDTNGCFARILEGEMTKNINLFSKVENNNPQTSKYR